MQNFIETINNIYYLEDKTIIIRFRPDDLRNIINDYQQAKEKIQEIKNRRQIYNKNNYDKSKAICPCCSKMYNKYNLEKHKKTKKYLEFIEKI